MNAAMLCVPTVAIAAPITPVAGIGSPAEDENRIERDVENHRPQHDEHRQLGFADAAHHRLEHEEEEIEHEPDERHAHEPERAAEHVGRDAHEPQQRRRASMKPSPPSTTDTSTIINSVCAAT